MTRKDTKDLLARAIGGLENPYHLIASERGELIDDLQQAVDDLNQE